MNGNSNQHQAQTPESDRAVNLPGRLPGLASREEEAEFWDTHDFTDYFDETEPVKIVYGGSISGPVGQIVAFR